ncbi:hypothetical protein SAMN05443633_10335 [Chryseobacterium arachidis]|uniref:Uncharacterized protein n=1 Tax=Chryseobacterium arachidis TaxID=1416778 RepID=A0A1M4Z2G2_9FLAO|nr:hypothetical protein [Chryseobacterium arachidis]SHF12200.1 hypothetical protein SAMN05443633_10335 [Chryseobacterium arachidis]
MVEHTGKINDEMRAAIGQKFDYDEFVNKANFRTALIKEKGRISFEIYNMVQKGDDFNVIEKNISSHILTKRELEYFIIEKYYQFSSHKENNTIDKRTVYRSLLGILIATFIGILVLDDLLLITNETSFFLLIPIYILNYWVIRLITGKPKIILLYFWLLSFP